MLKLARLLVCIPVLLMVIVVVPGLASADSKSQAASQQSVIQSYGTDTTIQQGMIVKLKPGDPTKVQPATSDDLSKMFGVVVAVNDAAIALSGSSGTNQVYVATFGRYNVLVSTQNGPIDSGDYVTVSSIDGIAMKAGEQQNLALGRAVIGFSGTDNVISTAKLKGGGSNNVAIGRIPVDIGISHNPAGGRSFTDLPAFLQSASDSIASKPVSSARIYLSLAILLISGVVAGSLLYGGVRNGMIAVGRNPMAKKSIVRNLIQVVLTSIIIFIIGLFGVYLLLRL